MFQWWRHSTVSGFVFRCLSVTVIKHGWTGKFFPLSVFRCISALVHHTSGGFCVCVLFWDEVLLPDELRAVSVSLVTAYRTCVDCQRPPVDAASRGVHRQTVQQLGHHLQTCLWLIHILSRYKPWPKYTKGLSPYLVLIIWSLKERYLN